MSVQFIAIDTTVQPQPSYTVTDEAREILQQFKKPFGIAMAVGSGRAGKSYIANRILKKPNAFSTSSNVQAHTRGLHIATELIETADGKLILVGDTEGVGAPGSTVGIDTNIVALAFSCASLIIFRSDGKIDQPAISTLECSSATVDLLQAAINAAAQQTDLGEHILQGNARPRFLWLLRDFTLKLKDSQGNSITANEYMESALAQYPSTKDALDKLFRERRCFPMVKPCARDADLETMRNTSPEFEDQVAWVLRYVTQETTPKLVNGCELTGPTLLALMDSMCAALSAGKVPDMMSASESMKAAATFETRLRCSEAFGTFLASNFTPNPKLSFIDAAILNKGIQHTVKSVWLQQQRSRLTADNTADMYQQLMQSAETYSKTLLDEWCEELKTSSEGGDLKECEHLLPKQILDALTKVVDTALQRASEAEKQITLLQQSQIEMEFKQNETEQQLLTSNNKIVNLTNDVAGAEQRSDDFESELASVKQACNACKAALSESSGEVSKVRQELEESQTALEEAEKQASDYAQTAHIAQESASNVLSELEEARESAQQDCDRLNQRIRSMTEEASNMKFELDQLASDKQETSVELITLRASLEAREEEVQTYTEDIARLKAMQIQYEDVLVQNKKKFAEVIASHEKDIKKQTKTIETLTASTSSLNAANVELKKKLEQTTKDCAIKTKQLEELKTEASTAKTQAAQVAQQLKMAQLKLAEATQFRMLNEPKLKKLTEDLKRARDINNNTTNVPADSDHFKKFKL